MIDTFHNPAFWVSVSALVVSTIGTTFSLIISKRSLRLAQKKEVLRSPRFDLYLFDVYSKRFEASRRIDFQISVTNRSDDNNSVSRAELQILYHNDSGAKLNIRVPCRENGDLGDKCISPPVRIDAHQTVSGRFVFDYNIGILQGLLIDEYILLLEDGYGNVYNAKQSLIREMFEDDTEEDSQA